MQIGCAQAAKLIDPAWEYEVARRGSHLDYCRPVLIGGLALDAGMRSTTAFSLFAVPASLGVASLLMAGGPMLRPDLILEQLQSCQQIGISALRRASIVSRRYSFVMVASVARLNP